MLVRGEIVEESVVMSDDVLGIVTEYDVMFAIALSV